MLVSRMIDKQAFEEGNKKHNHTYVYNTYIVPLQGISKNTFSSYRHAQLEEPKESEAPVKSKKLKEFEKFKEFKDLELPRFIHTVLQLLPYFYECERLNIPGPSHRGRLKTEEINSYLTRVVARREEMLRLGQRVPEENTPRWEDHEQELPMQKVPEEQY